MTIKTFKEGFIGGLGWSFGVTIGFVVISTIVVAILNALGGLPIIGSFIAAIVRETQNQLLRRTPLY
jgi:phage shock protein PspC (stress-responsive transcriptional regulator)